MKKQQIDERYVYSELSHKIIGAAFDTFNSVGPGRPEKTFQRIMGMELKERDLHFKEQVVADLFHKSMRVGTRRFDFVIEEKIVVELKVGSFLAKSDFEQLHEYLVMSGMQLGLLILFSNNGVVVKRIVNLHQ
ncbi:MAG: GxxExxY protein [Parcubacteria group bacterium]